MDWSALQPTKAMLMKTTDPTSVDATQNYPVVWVNTVSNSAWLLKDGTIQVLPPTSGNVSSSTGGESATSISDLESQINNIETNYMLKATYDADGDSIVDEAETIDGGSF